MIRFGKYVGRELLAEGPASRVYLCDDPDLRQPVAVKAFAAEKASEVERRRFLLEGRWLGRIEHPNVVHARVLETDTDDGPFFVMPYLPATLADETGAEAAAGEGAEPDAPSPPPLRVLDVLEGLLDGLAGLHAAGLLHRDVRPSNVLLTAAGTGRVKLCDLGAARFPDEESADPDGPVHRDGYVAPEARRTLSAADHRADLYAAAAVAFGMLTGAAPGDDPAARVSALADLGLAEAFVGPVSAALSEAPEARPGSAAALRDRLRAARPALETVERTSADGRLRLRLRAPHTPGA